MSRSLRAIYSNAFLVPGISIYAIFFIGPTIMSFYFAFTDWGIYGVTKFVGLNNFIEIFTDSSLYIAFSNTIIFTIITTAVKVVIGFFLALIVNQGLSVQGYTRTILFFPCILNNVGVGLLFMSIFHPTTGLFNQMLSFIGLESITRDWFGDMNLSLYAITVVEIWKWTGFHMLIFLAGLQTIPAQYYEALQIDGGNRFHKLRYITIPLIRPAFNTNIIFCIIGGLRVFEIVYSTTQGGPGHATEVLNTTVFKLFSMGAYGLSTAAGLLLFMLVSLITFPIYRFLIRKEVELS